ncbi:MAG: glycogen synthase GlgA [Panacagrimonas sp.]
MKILHVASECIPLIKTGGLADVLGALPAAQARLGADVRIALPAYRGLIGKLPEARDVGGFQLRGLTFRIIEGRLGAAGVWLVDCPPLYDREGDPYRDGNGHDFGDNAFRFSWFGAACLRLAQAGIGGWRPDVVHGHDWQAGTTLAWLMDLLGDRGPRRVFTIHNLAYQGRYARDHFQGLGLPAHWWHMDRAEFHGDVSFLKLGISSAQVITTVSPTYAREILTPGFGHGLDGLLRSRAAALHGILNGIDEDVWDPARDPYLERRYRARDVTAGKRGNRDALCAELQLDAGSDLLVGIVGRLTEQKGFDLAAGAIPQLVAEGMQFAILGAGDKTLERAFSRIAAAHPGRVGLRLEYDERLAHRIEAGADALLMPSRFEPCGLNQMYSQRYGTVPVVRSVGGLADTVTDATALSLADGSATGLRFEHADVGGVLYGLRSAAKLHANAPLWKSIQRAGMSRDFSWTLAARQYMTLYAV